MDVLRDMLRYGGVLVFFAPVWGRVLFALVRGKPWTGNKALQSLWTKGLPLTIACMTVGVAMHIVGRFVL